jgi:hypothetical protein
MRTYAETAHFVDGQSDLVGIGAWQSLSEAFEMVMSSELAALSSIGGEVPSRFNRFEVSPFSR